MDRRVDAVVRTREDHKRDRTEDAEHAGGDVEVAVVDAQSAGDAAEVAEPSLDEEGSRVCAGRRVRVFPNELPEASTAYKRRQ